MIYAAPPFDEGMPYIEYVDTRVSNVDGINCDSNLSLCYYLKQDTPFTTKEPNSVFYPLYCNEMEGEVPCFEQSFDPNNLLLSLNVLYKERYEKRTFFFKLEKNLSNIAQKWGSWGIGDTCLPLRGAYVENWPQACNNTGFGCITSYGLFKPKPFNCDANIFQREGTYYNPSIMILIIPSTPNSLGIKWMKKLHTHEAGHWLYWLMKGMEFENYEVNKIGNCKFEEKSKDPHDPTPKGFLAEAFADVHIFEFLFAVHTGYGIYEPGENGEVDTKCEYPIQISNNDPHPNSNCKNICTLCGNKIKSPFYDCNNDYYTSCADLNNSPCSLKKDFPPQTPFLRDIFDSVNSFKLDEGQDQISKPIYQVYHCLKQNNFSGTTIFSFINTLRDCLTVSENTYLNILMTYYKF